MNTNKYPGVCSGCSERVGAGDGSYDLGSVWCSPTVRVGDLTTCERYAPVERKIDEESTQNQLAQARRLPTEEERARQIERAAEDRAWAKQGLRRCKRCHGAGGSHSWPGFTCYDCGGHGTTVVG